MLEIEALIAFFQPKVEGFPPPCKESDEPRSCVLTAKPQLSPASTLHEHVRFHFSTVPPKSRGIRLVLG
jgi:hypothetical protein